MKIIAANWKLNKTPEEAVRFLQQFLLIEKDSADSSKRKILVFPSAVAFEKVSIELKDSKIGFGFQNISTENQGAFTGENSAAMGLSMGARYALVGHSERRALFSESSEMINRKLLNLQKLGMTPVYCVGESLVDRDAGKTNQVLSEQMKAELSGFNPQSPLIIAYEPVWAIGTGRVATTEQILDAHKFIFEQRQAPILYGGSVKPENAKQIMAIPHVDGLLVGGASLEVESFSKICKEVV